MSFLRSVIVTCLLLSVARAAPPNVVIFFADDLGYGDVGYQGGDVPTPNIDSIASGGVTFTDGYVTCPVCAPSRAGLLTGRYQQRFGFWDNIGPFRASPETEPGIPVDLPIVSERLKSLGYTTGLFGKTHDGDAEEMMAFNRWDEFYGFNNGASNYLGAMNRPHNPIFHNKEIVSDSYANRGIANADVIRDGVLLRDTERYLTDKLGEMASAFIARNKDRPFLCYIPFNAVHGPFQAPEELVAKFVHIANQDRRLVMAMLASLDANVGRVLAALDQHGVRANTMIWFLSDNGGHAASPNTPLRGKKGTYWEGGLRVPFCVRWDDQLAPDQHYRNPVISLDLLPTVIAAAGGSVAPHWELDGVNLLPYLTGQKPGAPHEALYWSWGPRKAIRVGDFKAISQNDGKHFALFDLAHDIGEQRDLAGCMPERLTALIARHRSWEQSLPPPQWGWNKALGHRAPDFGKPRPYHDRTHEIK